MTMPELELLLDQGRHLVAGSMAEVPLVYTAAGTLYGLGSVNWLE